ncbi:MAG: hypothetical protein Q9207_002540 [Kuettlingeria erythrocarpa]
MKGPRLSFQSVLRRLRAAPLETPKSSCQPFGHRRWHSAPPIPSHLLPTIRQSPFRQLLARNLSRRSIRHNLNKRFNSNKPTLDPTPSLGSPEPSLSLSQRLRKLSREYGWSALGVYLLLSALDFPFCFLAVRWIGTETIGRWESIIVEQFRQVFNLLPFSSDPAIPAAEIKSVGAKAEGYAPVAPRSDEIGVPGYDHGVKEAEERNKSEEASIWTQLALAYAIHKSFIFIRVPLTAAVTPKVVKVLRGWGWDIGKRRPKGISNGPKK